ncbi:MAG TPA: NUDIX hydrolase, partial [Streptomyces sp.]
MTLHDDAASVLKGYEAQPDLRDTYLTHLASHPDGMWKSCADGHITASALVIDPTRGRVL